MPLPRSALFSLAFSCLFLATSAGAQVQTGSISVRVVDDQGAVVPGVSVSLSSTVLPQPIVGATGADGVYQVPGLGLGTYTVRTSLQGFQTVVREGIVVRQGQTVPVDISMKVSALAEEVTVKGESPVIDTKSANVNSPPGARGGGCGRPAPAAAGAG